MENLNEVSKRRIIVCPETHGVERITNRVYNTVNNMDYHCDIYLPAGAMKDRKKYPVVILVHGEAPVQNLKDTGQYLSLGEYIASKGMAAVTFNHRMLVTGSRISEILDDITKARDFVESVSGTYNIDAARSCLWSISSGMPFGVFNALNYRQDDIKCFVGYYGFGDFNTLLAVLQKSNGEETVPGLINGTAATPMMIVRSGLDFEVINSSLDNFIRKCLEMNMNIEVHNHSSGHHAFDLLDDNERSRELIEKTADFIQGNLQTHL